MKDETMEPSGVLIINKPSGMTSHDVVGRIRRLYGLRRVGHTGTLDPMATGVLVLLIGRAAKAAEYLMCDRKAYTATLRLGLVTDSGDITGKILSQTDFLPEESMVQAVLESFRGEIEQIPPMYSALKVGGQKLVNLARRGITIEREPRKITIYSLKAFPTDEKRDYRLEVDCSGGTYIRTLCEDIGAALGCGGTMASLCRTATGSYGLNRAHTIDQLELMTAEERLAQLLPVESLFADLPALHLSPFYEKLIRGGCAVLQKKLGCHFPVGTRIQLLTETGSFFALGEAIESEEDSVPAVKAVKTFVL
ncbi:MAG: tRNA pseudouridine(55) synthase TruB [Ruminococcaceae bacterium]|nr:tRNA pseudouridine(55) synthase TruB [Oscillospiraceae bacterium]